MLHFIDFFYFFFIFSCFFFLFQKTARLLSIEFKNKIVIHTFEQLPIGGDDGDGLKRYLAMLCSFLKTML